MMRPVTPHEKIKAFERVKDSAIHLVREEIISQNEYREFIDRATKKFGNPLELAIWDKIRGS